MIKMTTLNEDISMTDLSAIKVPKTALPSNQSKISVASVVYKDDLFFAQSDGEAANQITDRVPGLSLLDTIVLIPCIPYPSQTSLIFLALYLSLMRFRNMWLQSRRGIFW